MAVNKDDAVNIATTQTVGTPVGNPSGPTTHAPTGLKRFFREVMVELKKTTWLTKDELTKSVFVILTLLVIVTVLLFAYDYIAARLMVFFQIVPKA